MAKKKESKVQLDMIALELVKACVLHPHQWVVVNVVTKPIGIAKKLKEVGLSVQWRVDYGGYLLMAAWEPKEMKRKESKLEKAAKAVMKERGRSNG